MSGGEFVSGGSAPSTSSDGCTNVVTKMVVTTVTTSKAIFPTWFDDIPREILELLWRGIGVCLVLQLLQQLDLNKKERQEHPEGTISLNRSTRQGRFILLRTNSRRRAQEGSHT